MAKTYQIVVAKPFKYQSADGEKLDCNPGDVFDYDGRQVHVDMLARGELAVKVIDKPTPRKRAPRKKAVS
jgi:hypothetical protein